MSDGRWRNIIVESSAKIKVAENILIVESEVKKICVPFHQINCVLLDSPGIHISTESIVKLADNGVKIIFCNNKHIPSCEISTINSHTCSSGRLRSQINWDTDRMEMIWNRLLMMKIEGQSKVLRDQDSVVSEKIHVLLTQDEKDINHLEAQAARLYFNALFGKGFYRRAENDINSALNYGYAILVSLISRHIVIHGYNTSLGIHHCSEDNPLNLSYDLVEPFRPFVDEFVSKNKMRDFDYLYRKDLVNLLLSEIVYKNKKMELQIAIEQYIEDVLSDLSENSNRLGDITYDEQV